MERSLIVETSTTTASMALVGPEGLQQRTFRSDRNHNALLFEPLTELLGADRSGIRRVLVGSGPGSYSGTRVGIAAAQGIGIALQCPVIAIPSILAVPSARQGARCLAIGDARRGSFWTAMIQHSRFTHEPRLCDAATLEEEVLAAQASAIPVIGFETSTGFPSGVSDVLRIEHPDASHLWEVWQAWDESARTSASAAIAQPIYLKPPHITVGKRPRLVE